MDASKQTQPREKFVSGFVSILGRPNVGKSTLINQILGMKIAAVSDKPQTTRTSIQGVLNRPGAQVVFLDTPGIHRSDSLINKKLAQEVAGALEGRDLLVFMADCTKQKLGADDERAVQMLRSARTPAILLLNKIDLLKDKSRLLPLIEKYGKLADFEEYIPVSALTGDGLDRFQHSILARLPEGPMYFPEDEITDQPERFFVTEMIREKVLAQTHHEVPHSVMVQLDEWKEDERLLRISATILVERSGQKAIVIGSKGARLKEIGTDARLELEKLLGRRIYLELFVKVRKDWRDKPAYLSAIDWKG